MSAILELEHVVKEFPPRRRGGGRVRAVDDVGLAIEPGSIYGLVGESGSGKTTLARCVLGLERATSGSIRFAGEPRELGFVFQQPIAALDPRMKVADLIAEPLTTHRLARGDALRRRVGALLAEVGLSSSLVDRYPHELSGGQAQRVVISRALSTSPRLLVLDEPTSALDVVVQAQILNLLVELREQHGLSLLLISHDLGVVGHLADRIGVMYLGRIVEEGPAAAVLGAPRHPYTRALVRSTRGRGRDSLDSAPPLLGETPPAWAVPTGCRFHPRCPLRRDLGDPEICERDDPRLRDGVACHFPERVR